MTLQLTQQTLIVGDREIMVRLPASQDQLLDEAIRCESSGSSDWDPYWGTLWETAPRTAALILQHGWQSPLRTLDLGCGIGVTGIASLLAGHDVTFSDHSTAATDLAVFNAALNGFADVRGLVFDWQHPPAQAFDLITASDILYDEVNHKPLLNTFQSMLSENGTIWIGDPGRANALRFTELAVRQNWCVNTLDEDAKPYPRPKPGDFHLLILTRTKAQIQACSANVESCCFGVSAAADSIRYRLPRS